MVDINQHDSALLIKAIMDGDAVLFLGAGASATSTNSKGERVKQGRALAERLATEAGFPYAGEPLPDVLEAVTGHRISKQQFVDILQAEYTSTTPSDELKKLFKYSWRRIYTWNIDDAIENTKHSAQTRRYVNGLSDKVSSYTGIEYVHVVHLHGEALKPEHGFIFTPKEYNARLNEDRHDWYRQAATDYVAKVPIFIGSRLEEPILSAELDRARPTPDSQLGLAFLVTPDDFTPIQLAGFASRNIVVVKGYLSDFVQWLDKAIGPQVTPLDVSQSNSLFTRKLAARITPTKSEVDTADSIVLHTWLDTKSKAEELQGLARAEVARAFLEGFPPTWKLAATDIPVWLTKTTELYTALSSSIASRDRMFLVYGQAGSGKTTALLQSMIRFMRENTSYPVYEIKSDAKSLRSSLELIHKLHKDEHAVVYVGDAILFGDLLEEDILTLPAGSLTVISSARTSEWRRHIERRVGDVTTSFEFQRFVSDDHAALIDRLLKYVPAPYFRKLSPSQRAEKLASSKDQLLIALKEATSSERFTKIIADEYENLPDDDCRNLLLIVGLATMARTGISKGATREAFNRIRKSLSFEGALGHLAGIVSPNPSDRYVARHEVYVRHIIENVADFKSIIHAAIQILRTYTKYDLPIVKNVVRLDGALFKFILNHDFIGENARRRNEIRRGLELYKSFEIDFQLDGHYWLQYGQYLAMFGELEPAITVLTKSIEAYPGNSYALHALADLQLRVAYERQNYDSETARLLTAAATTLEALHAREYSDVDYYPIVTLSEKYIGALIKNRQMETALDASRRYYKIISEIPHENEQMSKAKIKLAHFITHRTWKAVDDAPQPLKARDAKRRKKGPRKRIKRAGPKNAG
ncbi:tetratricopeptide (TPR) repeat protein [Rhodoblastus acidophilus]|uniref:SIR2 family protein n=1 Tax=Rhodoblastus acidophilus TaxID=1074 RepID=UPI002225A25C|nr:SIR2 family protein [Rhodoblastus acidophilus]MCW2283173.1 tetratricopeptide (TPR) repeat protein [Rhodoblastus acidophilus]MCW2332033.1 tetratricopeptide (TPR) repeat protein [Rhodoblastus acidophilus]